MKACVQFTIYPYIEFHFFLNYTVLTHSLVRQLQQPRDSDTLARQWHKVSKLRFSTMLQETADDYKINSLSLWYLKFLIINFIC